VYYWNHPAYILLIHIKKAKCTGVYASLIGDVVSLIEVITGVVDLVSTLEICNFASFLFMGQLYTYAILYYTVVCYDRC